MPLSRKSKYGNTNVYNERVRGHYFKVADSSGFNRPGQNTEALMNQSNTTFEDYLTLNLPKIPRTDTYVVTANYTSSINATTNNFESEIVLINITDSLEFILDENVYEAKDAVGTGVAADIISNGTITAQLLTGTDVRYSHFSHRLINLEQGKDYKLVIRWKSEAVDKRATIYKGLITLEQKTINQ